MALVKKKKKKEVKIKERIITHRVYGVYLVLTKYRVH